MRLLKRILSFLCVLTLIGAFGVAATAEEAHDPVTIRFSWWGGASRADATLAAVDSFMAQYPWITVECEYGSFDGWQDKCATPSCRRHRPD
jgi:oligogalacturonide transport system substrate-binding protein